MKKLILLALFFSFSATPFVSAQSNPNQKEVFQTTYNNSKSLVETQSYQFIGEMVFFNRTREKLNTDSNTLTINSSKISGQVISVQSENRTINVTGKIENYNATFNDDKQQISIAFNVKTATEILKVTIDVKPNGNAFLNVTSGNANTISWTGKLKKLK